MLGKPRIRLGSVAAIALALCSCEKSAAKGPDKQRYEHAETRELVRLVDDAAKLIETKGEAAFATFATPGSRWRHQETYIFVVEPEGTMRVHPDPGRVGKNQLDLEDVAGRPIIRGIIDAVTTNDARGWYHYEWPVPGGIFPRWKSTYVRLVKAPSNKRYIVGSGMYDDRMERAFVVEMVEKAVRLVERRGKAGFPPLYQKTGPFLVKDAYVFVIDPRGVELVNPAFPNLEGRDLLDVKDTRGKRMVREMLEVVRERGSGWVDYMWPKPGDSASTEKSTYVSKANVDGTWLLVGSGVYLADAPTIADGTKMTAPELEALVGDAVELLERRGEEAYSELGEMGSKWFTDETYFFVWTMDGTRVFHAADPSLVGKSGREAKDIKGRPYGEMFVEVAKSRSGEGWVHYMYPEPGDIFPVWKSTFLKRARFPSGKQYLVGAGVYRMQMHQAFIEDLVDRAAALIADKGPIAFDRLRDPTGPFRFMDVYVFVDQPDGTELVNAAQPSLEGRNIINLKDAKGKPMARDYIAAALERGAAWVEYTWYKPGGDEPVAKRAYVRKVKSGRDTYIVGSGVYLE